MPPQTDQLVQTYNSGKDSSWPGYTVTKMAIGNGVYQFNFTGSCNNMFGCEPTIPEARAKFTAFVNAGTPTEQRLPQTNLAGPPNKKLSSALTPPASPAAVLVGRWRITDACSGAKTEIEIGQLVGTTFAGRTVRLGGFANSNGRIANGHLQGRSVSFSDVPDAASVELKYTGVMAETSIPPQIEGVATGYLLGGECRFLATKI